MEGWLPCCDSWCGDGHGVCVCVCGGDGKREVNRLGLAFWGGGAESSAERERG